MHYHDRQMRRSEYPAEKIQRYWTVKVNSTTHQSPELLLKRMILITMEPNLAMGCDNFIENSVISFKYRQCDITTILMANIQNLQQWAGDEHESTLLYMTSVPKYIANTNFILWIFQHASNCNEPNQPSFKWIKLCFLQV